MLFVDFFLDIFMDLQSVSSDEFKEEHRLMCALDHPNLIHFYGYTAHYRFALIEHSDLGDLHTYLLRSSTLP